MRKILFPVVMLAALLAVALNRDREVRAQAFPTSDVQITVGVNSSLVVDVTKLAGVPACSKAAGCVATIEICNTKLGIATAQCVELNGTSNFGVTPLSWSLVETSGTAIVKYPVAKLQIGIPSAEANVTP